MEYAKVDESIMNEYENPITYLYKLAIHEGKRLPPKYEQMILETKSIDLIYGYVKDVIKERYPMIEKMILEEKYYWLIHNYAIDVIKGRWEEAEEIWIRLMASNYEKDKSILSIIYNMVSIYNEEVVKDWIEADRLKRLAKKWVKLAKELAKYMPQNMKHYLSDINMTYDDILIELQKVKTLKEENIRREKILEEEKTLKEVQDNNSKENNDCIWWGWIIIIIYIFLLN